MRRTPIEYEPGFFLSLVRQHNWPPGFRPQPIVGKRGQVEINEAAARGRAKRLASGDTGTINRLSRKGGVGLSDASKGEIR